MPDIITVFPQEPNKKIKVLASKSVMQRVIACAILSDTETTITNPSFCDDCKAALKIAEDLGAEVFIEENKISIIPGKTEIKSEINCGESGLGIRMFTPIISLFDKKVTINGKGSLTKRPIAGIEDALTQAGVNCETNSGYIPINISGKLKGGNIEIDGSKSSQVLTGLLTALPKSENNSVVKVKNLKSKPYIDLTLNILNDFGIYIENNNYKEFRIKGNQKFIAQNYIIEGDWSGAAFFLVAGLISGKVELMGLNIKSKQADIRIIDAVKSAGGDIIVNQNSIITNKSKLKAFHFDATNCPDLFPPLVVMAAYSEGTSVIKGVSRLFHKESNRAEALQKEFSKLGIKIKIENDNMLITGNKITGGIINSHNDHRIAMAAAVAALGAQSEIQIKNPDCVNKSYPDFFKYFIN